MKKISRKLINWFMAKKLKQKVRYIFVAIITVYFLLFSLVYMTVIRSSMFRYMEDNNYNSVIFVSSNLNTEFQNLSMMSQMVMKHPSIIKYLRADEAAVKAEEHDAVTAALEYSVMYPYVSSMYVFRTDVRQVNVAKDRITFREEVVDDAWMAEVEERAGGYLIRLDGDGAFNRATGEPVVSFIRIINDIDSQKPLGMLVINCTMDILTDTYKDDDNETQRYFSFYSEDGTELVKGEDGIANGIDFNEVEGFVMERVSSGTARYFYRIPDTPLIVAGSESVSFWSMISGTAIAVILLLILVTVMSMIFIGLFISVSITRPIERLVTSMEGVKQGWFKRVSLALPDDEIGHLKDSYNNMLVEINRLIEELLEEEKSRQKAELLMLQEQIKPHFLYNTLDTIGYMSLEHTADETYDAIETLGNFYRAFLSKGSKEITVEQEIAIVKNYLKLQKLRYGDIFEDIYKIEDKVRLYKIPKLIMQPLIENSLYHGIQPKGEKGVIRVAVFEREQQLCITVYDNGIGMDKELISGMMEEDNGKSFGLKATIERVRFYYGVEDVYEIKSEEGRYCEVVIKIPLQKITTV